MFVVQPVPGSENNDVSLATTLIYEFRRRDFQKGAGKKGCSIHACAELKKGLLLPVAVGLRAPDNV